MNEFLVFKSNGRYLIESSASLKLTSIIQSSSKDLCFQDCVRELEDCDELFPFKIEINWTEGEIHVARDAKELKGMNDNDMTEADCKPPVDSALRMNETG